MGSIWSNFSHWKCALACIWPHCSTKFEPARMVVSCRCFSIATIQPCKSLQLFGTKIYCYRNYTIILYIYLYFSMSVHEDMYLPWRSQTLMLAQLAFHFVHRVRCCDMLVVLNGVMSFVSSKGMGLPGSDKSMNRL